MTEKPIFIDIGAGDSIRLNPAGSKTHYIGVQITLSTRSDDEGIMVAPPQAIEFYMPQEKIGELIEALGNSLHSSNRAQKTPERIAVVGIDGKTQYVEKE